MDVYFLKEYGTLCEIIDNGQCECFEFSNEYGTVRNMFIKRKIPLLLDGVEYFDAITPYGYGGPIMIGAKDEQLLEECYARAWQDYCLQNRIVSEFVRFHPLENNMRRFSKSYDVSFNRQTVAIILSDSEYALNQFTSVCRNTIRKAMNHNVTAVIDENLELLDEFKKLYYSTMQKNNAKEYYFFHDEFFGSFKNALRSNSVIIAAFFEEHIISAALFMLGDQYIHYHLSATDPNFYGYAANNLILSEAVRIGRERGLEMLHLGGGVSPEDSLFKFKRSFGKTEANLCDFYVGKRVSDYAVYNKLVELRRKQGNFDENDSFFPRYRAPEK